MTEKTVYLNGDYLPIDQAKVSVLDRGFLFGDGVYEVIPVYGENLLRVDEHLARLDNSLSRVSMKNPLTKPEWKSCFEKILEQNPGNERAIYLQITRGVYPARDLKIIPGHEQTVFMMVMAVNPVNVDDLEEGIHAVTIEDFRWYACHIKSISLIANVMLREQASRANVVDAILIRDGKVTEGTASNMFMVKDNVLVTPPTSQYLLPGITRDLVLELAQKNGINCEVRQVDEHELTTADEIWLTSSTREIAPVVRLNGNTFSHHKAGPVWKKMIGIYQEYKQQLRRAS